MHWSDGDRLSKIMGKPEVLSPAPQFVCLPQVQNAAGGVARFTFAELCDAPRGAADYCAIAAHFHTVFLSAVPVMSLQVCYGLPWEARVVSCMFEGLTICIDNLKSLLASCL